MREVMDGRKEVLEGGVDEKGGDGWKEGGGLKVVVASCLCRCVVVPVSSQIEMS
jgi:hypothetical protein